MLVEKWDVGMVECDVALEIPNDIFILRLPCEVGRGV